jgi:hypothetical protein
VKKTPTTIAVLVLSLAAWAFFYLAGVPLGAAETTVVVGVVALLVVLISLAMRRIRKPAEARKDADHS